MDDATRRKLEDRARTSSLEVERQRGRASWSSDAGLAPTMDGLVAGYKAGAASGIAGAMLVYTLHLQTELFGSMSTGGKVWLVCIAGMAGFFINSEQAVVGSDARAKAAIGSPQAR